MDSLVAYIVGQMQQTMQSHRSELGDKLDKIDNRITELTGWCKRLAILAALWGTSLALNLGVDPDKIGQVLVALFRSIK
jgi:hypothetical protein